MRGARVTGTAFLAVVASTAASFLLVDATTGTPDMLFRIAENEGRFRLGILLDLACSVGILVLSIALYSVLREESEPIALLGLCSWVVEAALLAASKVNLFVLATLSVQSAAAGSPASEASQTLGTVLLGASKWGYNTLLVFFSLGGLAFYALLYRSRLVPPVLALWGIAAVSLVLIGCLSAALGARIGGCLLLWPRGGLRVRHRCLAPGKGIRPGGGRSPAQ